MELFCSVFSRIQTEYGEMLSISSNIPLYSVWLRENMDQNNAKYRLFHAVPCFNYKKSSNYLLRKLKLKIMSVSNCFNNKLSALLNGFHCFNFQERFLWWWCFTSIQFPIDNKLLPLFDTPLQTMCMENIEFQEFKYISTKNSLNCHYLLILSLFTVGMPWCWYFAGHFLKFPNHSQRITRKAASAVNQGIVT